VLETITPRPTPQATTVAMIAPEEGDTESDGRNWNNVIAYGALIGGLALASLAGVAVFVLWREDNK
jgi:hypothetical protein